MTATQPTTPEGPTDKPCPTCGGKREVEVPQDGTHDGVWFAPAPCPGCSAPGVREGDGLTVYVAGKFGEYESCRAFMDRLLAAGARIGFDWTRTKEFGSDGHPLPNANSNHGADLLESDQRKHATDDLNGVLCSDAVVLLSHGDLYGALIEVGAALATGKRVIVVAPHRHSIFFSLPQVTVVETEDDAFNVVMGLTSHPATPVREDEGLAAENVRGFVQAVADGTMTVDDAELMILRHVERWIRNAIPAPPSPETGQDGWQPIESAPKDGRTILLAGRNGEVDARRGGEA